jgi:hypothetical protein
MFVVTLTVRLAAFHAFTSWERYKLGALLVHRIECIVDFCDVRLCAGSRANCVSSGR